MRIVGGEFRSRRLRTLPGTATRPTSDKLREALFDVLGARVAGSAWYDCYAGSGAVGLEALSRSAACAVFVERSRAAARVLRANVAALGVEPRCIILNQPVLAALAQATRPADFIYLDPPYSAAGAYRRVLELLGKGAALKAEGIVIVEHARRSPLDAQYGKLARYRVLEQGDSALSFFRLSANLC
jgi:16S rRNA (guanine(966)-N(2))-methyltransferase RsmD